VDYTLIIPTFNRPSQLAALLAHLRRSSAHFPIIIIDSSAEEVREQNAVAIAASGLSISHKLFPESTTPQKKFAEGFRRVETRYASLCPDDDIVFVAGLQACVSAMKVDPTLAICDGPYLSFNPLPAHVDIRIEYDGPSIDQDTPITRMSRRLAKFEAATYAVFRIGVARAVFEGCSELPSSMFWEMFTSLASLAIGKHKRISCAYMARRTGQAFESTERKRWHPLLWARQDPEEMSDHFVIYMARLSEFIANNPRGGVKWPDIAIDHQSFFKNGRVELTFSGTGAPQFSIRQQAILEQTLTNISNQRKRLVVKQGNLSGRLGFCLEIPTETLADVSAYCASSVYLVPVWKVARNCCYLVASHPARVWRTYRSAASGST
jgi:glycosyltransferase domain-containing protein